MKENIICLVSPPTRANSYVFPFALLHLSAWLKKDGIFAPIVDVKKKTTSRALVPKDLSYVTNEIVERIKNLKPEYIGMTCFTYDYNSVVKLAKLIKSQVKTKIIVGGIHPTLKPFDFLFENSPFDYIVAGDGEIPLAELLKNKSFENIPGLGYKGKDGKFRVNENNSTADYSLLDRLDYDNLDIAFYTMPNPLLIRYLYASGIHIMTSKGCPFSCTFCANRAHKVLYRPIKAIVDEIAFFNQRYHIDSFYILDDTFGIKRERIIEFLDELNKKKLRLFWGMETRVNLVDDDLIKRLARSQCIQVDFGVESGSQTSLDRMQKGIKVEDSIRAFDLCKKYHIRTFANIMFNTPGETEEDVYATVKLIKRIRPTVLGVMLTLPLLGTEIYRQYVMPEIDKSEYHLFENDDMFVRIQDKRFKLAKHDIDLTKLRESFVYTYMFPRMMLDCTMNFQYWKVILFSKKKIQYLSVVAYDLIIFNLWRALVYVKRLYNRMRNKILTIKINKS